jgi:hypothetical protein
MSELPQAEGLRTQVSGKYSPDNPGLFAFRDRLVGLGVQVGFPAGGTIIEYAEDFAITTPEEADTPFPDTEEAFLRAAIRSDFHIVYNIWGDEDGYIGESTAIETVRAMATGVPTVWLRPPGRLSPHMDGYLVHFVKRACLGAWVEPLDRLPDAELKIAIGKLAARETGVLPGVSRARVSEAGIVHYGEDGLIHPIYSDEELSMFQRLAWTLIANYRASWERYRLGKT